MEKLERYLQFMREAERLKNVLRSARTSTGRHESTAEHTWRLALLALVLADEKPELDLPRVLAMCLVHDLGEAYEGDIPAVAQCDPASKAAAELAAMERLTPLLPAEAAARIRTLWEEYEACATPEARWVKALDKAETILQHNQGANPADFDYEFNDLWRGVVPRRCAPAPTAPPARRRDGPARRTLTECFFRNEIPCALPDGPSGQALSIFTTSACGSSAPKTLLPATSTSAPAP